MQLIKVQIDGYKHLKNTCVNFNETCEDNMFDDELPVRFFIGLNGSGKSVFLEGICFLFSRIVQNETPDFTFTLIYRIWRERTYLVEVKNGIGEETLDIRVMAEGETSFRLLHTFEGHRELLPDHVFTCASGSNNHYFDIMVHSPRTSLYNDLFDMSLLGKSRKSRKERRERIEKTLTSLKALEENPISMFVDEENSVLVLAAFFAVLPAVDFDQVRSCIKCRQEILAMLDSMPQPITLSFTLDAKRVAELGNELGQYGAVFRAITEERVLYEGEKEMWNAIRLYQDETPDAEDAHGDRVLSFLFEPCIDGDNDSFVVKALNDFYHTPMELLSKLMLARNQGIIREAHMGFRIQSTLDIVEENAFSEGEYMLLVRLGLFALGREYGGVSQCLFLMDEPDVYLNEYWDIDFVSMIHRIYEGSQRNHEIVIATHSSLMLTDAFPNQLYYFQKKQGQVRCLNVRASTFGGSRNEIMEQLFLTGNSVGTYSYRKIEEILAQVDDIQKLEACLKYVGSGYLRLRLLDKIQLLRK
ncbi:MAG: hypothetical protein HFG65_16115 [Hungatella sp.]|nr:hypothetical protein [Hungatella sp.]